MEKEPASTGASLAFLPEEDAVSEMEMRADLISSSTRGISSRLFSAGSSGSGELLVITQR